MLMRFQFVKQTSTKLEKAEILQMTVGFLHRIHRDGKQKDLSCLLNGF